MNTIKNAIPNFLFVLILICLFFSCKKEEVEPKAYGQLCFKINSFLNHSLKSTNTNEKFSSIVVSIDKADGTHLLSLQKISLKHYNGIYFSEPFTIEEGTYKLTYFALIDSSEQVKFAAPLSGSAMAAYVEKPLSIDFSVLKDQIFTLVPEVISAIGVLPGDFGFTNVKFNSNKSISIFPYAFLNSTSGYEPSTATIIISDGLTNLSTTSLLAKENIIELPDKSNYIIKIQKSNYITYQRSFTNVEIESMVTPLIIILQPEIPNLMASYTFEGNINDVSGNSRNGTFTDANLTTDRFGMVNSAYYFNGSNHIKLPVSFDVLPRTISLWFNTNNVIYNDPEYGALYQSDNPSLINGSTGIAIKDIGGYKKLLITACAITDTFNIVANRWYNVAITIDASKNINYYVDGVLIGSKSYTIPYVSGNGALYAIIGASREENKHFFDGKIDDIRIYNRSLSSSEIKVLCSN